MAYDYLSLKGIETALRKYSQSDPNIKSFGFGQLFDVNGKIKTEQLYPQMWVSPINSQPVISQNGFITVNRTFEVLFYDIRLADGTNEIQVVSDCEELGMRFLRWLMTANDPEINVISSPTITPFTEKFLDDVAGVTYNMVIEFSANADDCDDPNTTTNINFI